MHSSSGRRSGRSSALAVLAGAVILSACAGENLFQIAASVGGAGPTVEITAPGESLNIAGGAAVQVRAEVTAPNGLSGAAYSGIFVEGGEAAFVAETESFAGQPAVSLDNTLDPVAVQGTGDVWIIVEVTDTQGEAAADTVKVTIG